MLKNVFKRLKDNGVLIHNITNYVTVNDCANILLACGASPIMADDCSEVEEITSICSGLNINIGTLNQSTIEAMFLAGKKANMLGHPVLLDPVGVGASRLRTKTAVELLEEIKFTVIRGNISEIKTLALGSGKTNGVDANVEDIITLNNLESTINFAKKFAKEINAIIVITGAIDLVVDKDRVACIYNGDPMMSKVTGTGCQLSALSTAFIAANKANYFEALVASVCVMGIAGELAKQRMSELDGNSSYRNYIIDAIYNLTPDELVKRAKYEIF